MALNKFRTHKYNANKTEQDGYSFSSKLEAAVYQFLKECVRAKEFDTIEVQQHVYLSEARILYVPDFKCTNHEGKETYVEAKGFEGERWPTIKKLWKHYGPAPLHIYKGSYTRLNLSEIILPKEKK